MVNTQTTIPMDSEIQISMSWNSAVDLFLAITTSLDGKYLMESMDSLVYHSNVSYKSGTVILNDDDTIIALLNLLPSNVTDVFIGICIDTYKNKNLLFSQIENLDINVKKSFSYGKVVQNESIRACTNTNGLIIGKFTKINSCWEYIEINQGVNCSTNNPIQEVLVEMQVDSLN